MKLTKGIKQLVEEANAVVNIVLAEDVKSLHGNSDTQFVDLREIQELQREGQIPGAYHAPRGMLEFWVDPDSPYHKPVFSSEKNFILYCASGWRSALACKALVEMGMKNVSHIEGGFTAWKSANGEVQEYIRKSKK